MANLTSANQAILEKQLSKLIRSHQYGVVTYKEYVQKHLANGGQLMADEVTDDAALNKARQEYEAMRTSSNWVPIGNQSHPRTIRYNQLRDMIENNPPTKLEYCIKLEDGVFCSIPKLVFDWATEGARS